MPAVLSTTNGRAAFADSKTRNGKTDAWHQLGQPVGHLMDAEEVLREADLGNWDVRKVPLYADLRKDPHYNGQGSAAVLVPSQYATVFNNPVTRRIQPLGVVGERYETIQNEYGTELLNTIVKKSGAHFETGGSLRDYTETFVTMKLPNTFILEGLEGEDVSEWYISWFNNHTGDAAMQLTISQIRVVCGNTAAANIHGAKSRFKVRHTAGYRTYAEQAAEALGLFEVYRESFEAEVRALFESPFSVKEMKGFTEDLVDLKKATKDSKAATQRQNEANAILKLYVESPTIKGTAVAGTRWGAYNAVTEYVDHYAGVRGAGDDEAKAVELRAVRTLTTASVGGGLKESAWSMLTN